MSRLLFAAALIFSSLTASAQVDDLTRVYEDRLFNACYSKVSRRRVKNPRMTCACVAERHVQHAKKNSDWTAAARKIQWVISLYSQSSTLNMEAMARRNPAMADADFEITTTCYERMKEIDGL